MSTESTDTSQAPLSSRIRSLLSKANIPAASLTPEQRIRAISADTEKQGLGGQALITWILEAKNGSQQIADAKAQRETEEREARKAERASRPRAERKPREAKDPEAKALADKVNEFTPMDSKTLTSRCRYFLNNVQVERMGEGEIVVRHENARGEKGGLPEATFSVSALREFASKKEGGDKEVKAKIRGLRKGSNGNLWPHHLAAKIVLTIPE